MNVSARVLTLCLVLGSPTGAWAQPYDDVARCRGVADDAERLACYDAIQITPFVPRSKYEPISLADLQADPLSYRGRLVEVAGWIRPERDLYRLGSAAEDQSSVPIDLRVLSRPMRDDVAQRCPTGCQATIQGRVGPVAFVTGIVAETVVVR